MLHAEISHLIQRLSVLLSHHPVSSLTLASVKLASETLASETLASVMERKGYDVTYATFGFGVFVIMYFQSYTSTVLHQTATFLTLKYTF